MKTTFSSYSAQGKRSNNEDAVLVVELEKSKAAIVADGLGGLELGEVASQMAVQSISDTIKTNAPDEDILLSAIQKASNEIAAMQTPMRTTIAVVWIANGSALAANVGDSRIYQFRDGQIIYQSMDHSVAQMSVLVGEISPSEIRHCKDRNRLIRTLGDEVAPKVDCKELSIQPGDRFLLCTDGFWEPVLENQMIETSLQFQCADNWLDAMKAIVESFDAPKQDNHSAVCIVID